MRPQSSTTPAENWRPIPGYEGWYEASDLGRIRRVAARLGGPLPISRYRILQPIQDRDGYLHVSLCRGTDASRRVCSIHRLILAAFTGPFALGEQANHINGVKADNRLGNLEKVVQIQNMRHAVASGLHNPRHGSRHPDAKLTEDVVREIRSLAPKQRQAELARKFGISQSAISLIVNGRRWQHV